jgi:glycosyltransferase involved in cell wall biosynthesis
MSEKKCKIVMTTMFQNEAKNIGRMLESCYKYIDFFVIQNNGSTDGTDQIVKDFFTEKQIPGVLYDVEEGWVGFGWNRDHLIQYTQSVDHGCDWILKMDCDEILEVDDDFDWSILDQKEVQAWHIPAVQGTAIYHRAWMWNANMKWRFNHDPCHETIYCEDPAIGDQFQRVDLPKSFRQIGFNEGQSWGVPTKFMSHALILEEKMMRENSFMSDMYHFWYIGKSYFDAFESNAFPLGDTQKKEYGRRCIYYFEEYINAVHNYRQTQTAQYIDETSYLSMIMIGQAYGYLGDTEKELMYYKAAEPFAPERNDHLIAQARKYMELKDWNKMLKVCTPMIQEDRVNPFPRYVNFIDSAMYHDGGPLVKDLWNLAVEKVNEEKNKPQLPFFINTSYNKRMFIVDNFYNNPDQIRNFALSQVEFKEDLRWYKGLRSTTTYRPKGLKEAFEHIIGERIKDFEQGWNGCFQITRAHDPQVYHYDQQTWAAMIYLTPNAPLESGTRLHQSKINDARHSTDMDADKAFSGGFYDSNKFHIVDSAGNLYNRLVIMDARCIHSAGPYFGQNEQDGRLTHLFFFD